MRKYGLTSVRPECDNHFLESFFLTCFFMSEAFSKEDGAYSCANSFSNSIF